MLPYKLDHELHRQPWVTYAIALLCVLIFYLQSLNVTRIERVAEQFCAANHGMNFVALVGQLEKDYDYIDSTDAACRELMITLHGEKQPHVLIEELAGEEAAGFEAGEYTTDQLALAMSLAYEEFAEQAPVDLTRWLSYRAGSFNPFSSFLSAFTHADWGHVIGNLLFFLAFAGAVEVFIAHTGKFLLSLFAIEVGLDFSWSLAMLSSPQEMTLGLSGIVSGMIGFLAYAVPRGQIRCLFGILFYFWRGSLAIWMLAIWYVGWDVFYLVTSGASSVNYLAHVMGAVLGYGLAWQFFRRRKNELQDDIEAELVRYRQEQVHKVGRP